jgi:hypothetical protein
MMIMLRNEIFGGRGRVTPEKLYALLFSKIHTAAVSINFMKTATRSGGGCSSWNRPGRTR